MAKQMSLREKVAAEIAWSRILYTSSTPEEHFKRLTRDEKNGPLRLADRILALVEEENASSDETVGYAEEERVWRE